MNKKFNSFCKKSKYKNTKQQRLYYRLARQCELLAPVRVDGEMAGNHRVGTSVVRAPVRYRVVVLVLRQVVPRGVHPLVVPSVWRKQPNVSQLSVIYRVLLPFVGLFYVSVVGHAPGSVTEATQEALCQDMNITVRVVFICYLDVTLFAKAHP